MCNATNSDDGQSNGASSAPIRLDSEAVMLSARLLAQALRGIAYKIQEAAHGGLSKPTLRRLKILSEQSASGVGSKLERQAAFKPGTTLLREWNGTTHEVQVLADGFEWRGHTFASLSKIANAITGAHWSGPRFFGLRARTQSPVTRLREGKND